MGLGSLKLLQFSIFLFLKSVTIQRNLVMHIFPNKIYFVIFLRLQFPGILQDKYNAL